MLYLVALLSPPYASLSYSDPPWLPAHLCPWWRPGLRVAVPLGKGAARAGVILHVSENGGPEAPGAGPLADGGHAAGSSGASGLQGGVSVRPMLWPLDSPDRRSGQAPALLAPDYMDMIVQLAIRQATTPGRILGSVLPRGLRVVRRIRVREFVGGGKPVLHALGDLAGMDENALLALGRAFLEGRAEVLALAEDAASTELCSLAADPPWPVRPNAVKQRQVLEMLLERGSLTRRQLHAALPDSAAPLSALLKAGLVDVRPVNESEAPCGPDPEEALLPPPSPPFELSPEQRLALDSLRLSLDKGESATHLLFGVTGSGKTAVYLELALACLERGRSALLLAPEVALALKLRRDLSRRFPGTPVFLFHGGQPPAQREALFRDLAARRAPCLVTGTRSALFLPLPPLGAIVLDEEHDASFKQDEGFHYQAKEVAWHRAVQHKALLLLGSATPDVKTYHAALRGDLPLSRLDRRVGGGGLPAIDLVDIRDQPSSSLLAPASLAALRETVARGEQAVVLLNRRGYSPLMYCLSCGKAVRCPHCDIGLSYHKRREQLLCHYCGFTRPFPSPCGHCGSLNFLPMGEGTERLEERLAGEDLTRLLGGRARVLRLDRDSTRRPGRAEEILTAFARQEAQILVGTQMLSKGHHFPQVTLAVVADADLGLNLPDYRAAERSFQLLVQSAGRAGRGEKPGRVLIQTRDQSHYCWRHVARADYEAFYEQEIALREKRRYPPFVKLGLARVSFPADDARDSHAFSLLEAFASALREAGRQCGVVVLGPAPSPLARLQNRLRFQLLLKANDWQTLRHSYSLALRQALPKGPPKEWKLGLDLDPVNML